MSRLKTLPETHPEPGAHEHRLKRGGVARSAARARMLFLLPAALWVLAFTIFPLLFALYVSLFGIRPGRPWRFVGLENFERLFTDANLHNALRVTLTFVSTTLVVEMLLGFALALLFNREMRGRQLFRTLMTLPLFATPVAIGYLGITLFYEEGGPINALLQALIGFRPPWLSDPTWALIAVIIIDVWQWTPFVFLVTLAGLQSLPDEVYEAAAVDGASSFQIFRAITLPLMAPTLLITLLLRLVEAFKVFDIPASLTLGGPGRATEVYSLFTYRTALRFFDLGFASAQGFLLLIIVMTIVTVLFTRVRRLFD
ncbi:MAG: sugar ABC transporter permease [Chloroflexales bacterium]|nr:sugar ABC transporter permease [Chloroflexales bacterium]